MPRTTLPPTLALALLLLAPGVLAALAVPEPVQGEGKVTAFTVRSDGPSRDLHGGVADYTLLCADCFLNLTIASAGFVVVQNGAQVALAPGTYQVREFSGRVSWTRVALGDYDFALDGVGQVMRVA